MIRKQIHIEEEQQRRLSRLAKELGVSEAEIISRGIDLTLSVPADSTLPDFRALERQLGFIKRLARRRVVRKTESWTREEIHDRSRR